MENEKIKVLVCGAAGNMGRQTARSILQQEDMSLVGCFDKYQVGEDLGELLFGKANGIEISDDLTSLLEKEKPQVMVDFTRGDAVAENVLKCLEYCVSCIIRTTGIPDESLEKIRQESEKSGVSVFIAPNFSIGAVLMMKFSKEAAKYYQWAEIVELHHEKKADAPSGTALRTAKLMAQERDSLVLFGTEITDLKTLAMNTPPAPPQGGNIEKVPGVRGGISDGVRIHSIRLPGLLAHQEVICGGLGETLTIRHDSLSRECFMPGVMLAIRKVGGLRGLVTGLENIM
jgi:4-hydroxy-tetrahydrodipicolinate reductase